MLLLRVPDVDAAYRWVGFEGASPACCQSQYRSTRILDLDYFSCDLISYAGNKAGRGAGKKGVVIRLVHLVH